MTFKIHYRLQDGSEDFVIVSGDTVEEIREKSEQELARRGGTQPWSEEL